MQKTSAEKTRVALIGAGFIAETHLHALRELDDVEVTTVCDVSPERAASLQRRFNIPGTCASVEEMLEQGPPDIAHLLVPPPLHIEMGTTLLSNGVGVLMEKPMGLSEAACRELAELAANRELPLGVNQNFCYHPAFRELETRLAANEIGPVQFVSSILNLPLRQLSTRQFGHWMFRHPQNILFELGCHPFSMIHALLGRVREARTRVSDTVQIDSTEFHRSWRTMIDCERGAAMAYINVGHEFPVSRLTVIGPDGSLEADLVTGAVTRGEKTRWLEFYDLTVNDKHNARRLKKSARRNFWGYPLALFKIRPRQDLFYVGMRESIRAFHDAVRAERTPPICGVRGSEIIRYCETVWEGREESRYVVQPEPDKRIAEAEGQQVLPFPAKTVLVTGATGFIGSHLVQKLLAAGYAVRAFVRSAGWLPSWLQHPFVEIVEGRLADPAHLDHAVAGVDAVVHLATGLFDTWEETERAAVQGTRALANACLKHDVHRLVFTSSIAALYLGGLSTSDQVTAGQDLDARPEGRSIYARAKIACEKHLREAYTARGLPVVVLRPGVVVGSRGPTRHSGVGFWPRDNHCLGWGAGDHALPFVLVGDVAAALVAALEVDAAIGQVFNLAGEVRLSAREYVAEMARRTGRPIQFHSQNLWVMQGTEIGKWFVKVAARKPDNQFPSFRDLKTRALRPWFDCSAAREVLGWRPEADRERFLELGLHVPLEEGG